MTKQKQKAPAQEAGAPGEEFAGFEVLGLHQLVLDAIRDAGYTTPTPIQREAIPLAQRGRDLIGLAGLHAALGELPDRPPRERRAHQQVAPLPVRHVVEHDSRGCL